jgi:hypothetical protein
MAQNAVAVVSRPEAFAQPQANTPGDDPAGVRWVQSGRASSREPLCSWLAGYHEESPPGHPGNPAWLFLTK